jgi:hypothetical protein
MENIYSAWQQNPNGEGNNAHRWLRRLRIALVFWLVSFILTVIWFTNSPAF